MQAHPFSQPHQRHIHKESDRIVQRTLSGCFGRGDLNHNNRSIITENVNKDRIRDDIIICQRSLKTLYHELFDEALAEYNNKQTRRDRKITNYQEHIRHSRQEKEFHEAIFQVGNRDDTGVDSDMCKEAAAVLEEYARSFEERNPHLKLFNAVIHMDEATPHLHIDYITVGHYKRGQDTQNGIAQALKEMGYGEGKQAIARWRAAEVEVLNAICLEHCIQPLAPEKARGTLEIPEYKEKRRQADELAEQNAQAEAELFEKRLESEKLDQQIEDKSAQVKAILNYIPDYEKEFQVEDECEQLCRELTSLLDGKLSIMKHSDEIISKAQRLSKIMKKLSDSTHKSGDTVYALRERLDRSLKSAHWQRTSQTEPNHS